MLNYSNHFIEVFGQSVIYCILGRSTSEGTYISHVSFIYETRFIYVRYDITSKVESLPFA